jgi:hypothetical protein
MTHAFFSQPWCEAALAAENAATADIFKRFRKGAEFTHVLALEVADRPGVLSHVEYVAGRAVAWTAGAYDEELVWARFSGNLEAWTTVSEGRAKASNLVMAGKLKLTKGAMKDALENAAPFDRLVACFGAVPTDWSV